MFGLKQRRYGVEVKADTKAGLKKIRASRLKEDTTLGVKADTASGLKPVKEDGETDCRDAVV